MADFSGTKILLFIQDPEKLTKWYEDTLGWEQGMSLDLPSVTIVSKPQLTPPSTPEKPDYVSTWLDMEGNCWQFRGGK